jgi:hypothetical protein
MYLGNVFAPTARQASSNYGIGTDGRIAGFDTYITTKSGTAVTTSSKKNIDANRPRSHSGFMG